MKKEFMSQTQAPIYEALERFREMRVVPFDVPGHKHGKGNPELTAFLGEQCVSIDVNSMKPLDNLCHPVSVIHEAELLAADAFGAEHAFLMVGGTTSSVQSMVLSCCKRGDSRVHIYFDNALRFIRRCKDEYDLIIVDSNDPFGPSEGYFTREFYGICYNALRDDGIMVNQQGSPFYKHDADAMQRSHKRIVNTFPISRVYQAHIPTYAAGYWLFGFASKKYHPIDDFDEERWKKLHLSTRYYTTKLHVGSFYLPAYLEKMLEEVEL